MVEIKAVHQTDLKGVLKKISLWKEFSSGELKCPVCKDVLNFNNVGIIRSINKKYVLICKKFTCVGNARDIIK